MWKLLCKDLLDVMSDDACVSMLRLGLQLVKWGKKGLVERDGIVVCSKHEKGIIIKKPKKIVVN
jgi:hypothetical protein